MIVVTRLNGGQFGVNPDLVQRIDSAPDTILTLIDGTKYIVEESMGEVIDRINEHRSQLLARAQELAADPHADLLGRDLDDRSPYGTHGGHAGPHGGSHRSGSHAGSHGSGPAAHAGGAGPVPSTSSEPGDEGHLAPAVPLRPRSR
ncbi:flagellar FlbD family protein [Cellulomonas marina]|uniref:Uncharacterized protein YlzI, FlbEa/FlbD family n=1 Tax=Cellulomonas marina TaxID=988821 RepID=A0A1I1AWP2_9CELL|nr:flagellar FlbD family protein [Cellulomonas marina]GIG30631.1 hypothetical protein Cma02nite_32310 [Cellulomonas marina]SFB42471.1 Uncharacterized protein YlzI, FlbEa/FlbD family [Cellulomonas marina]